MAKVINMADWVNYGPNSAYRDLDLSETPLVRKLGERRVRAVMMDAFSDNMLTGDMPTALRKVLGEVGLESRMEAVTGELEYLGLIDPVEMAKTMPEVTDIFADGVPGATHQIGGYGAPVMMEMIPNPNPKQVSGIVVYIAKAMAEASWLMQFGTSAPSFALTVLDPSSVVGAVVNVIAWGHRDKPTFYSGTFDIYDLKVEVKSQLVDNGLDAGLGAMGQTISTPTLSPELAERIKRGPVITENYLCWSYHGEWRMLAIMPWVSGEVRLRARKEMERQLGTVRQMLQVESAQGPV